MSTLFLEQAGLGHITKTPDGLLVRYLLHWRVLGHLVARLRSAHRQEIKDTHVHQSLPFRITAIEDDWPMVDAHFHWDKLTDTHRQQILAHTPLRGLVANYAFPESWPNEDEMRSIDQCPQIVTTIGIHPKAATAGWTQTLSDALIRYVHWKPVCAIGECGLDTSTVSARGHLKQQRAVLKAQARIAYQQGLAIVIHSRGRDEEVRTILRAELPASHRVHVHCFTGEYSDVEAWSGAFRACTFGFTSLILDGRKDAMLRALSLDRMVVESDAPFLPPPRVPFPNSPWSIWKMIDHIGRVKNLPPIIVAKATSANTEALYQVRFPR